MLVYKPLTVFFFVHSNLFLSIFNEWRIHSTHLRNPSFLPSCRASFMMDAPPGGSRLQGDLKKGWTCRQASSPGLTPSHIPLKSRTFSSSRDMISVSFCLNSSDQQRQTDRKTQRQTVRNLRQMCVCACYHTNKFNRFLSPLISFALVSSCLLSSSVSLGIPSSSSLSLSNKENKDDVQHPIN